MNTKAGLIENNIRTNRFRGYVIFSSLTLAAVVALPHAILWGGSNWLIRRW